MDKIAQCFALSKYPLLKKENSSNNSYEFLQPNTSIGDFSLTICVINYTEIYFLLTWEIVPLSDCNLTFTTSKGFIMTASVRPDERPANVNTWNKCQKKYYSNTTGR